MFGSILTQATALFDRRALVNVFFPVLFFWGLLAFVIISEIGWAPFLGTWKGLSVMEQTLFAIGFVGWATLWSFLAIASRSQRIRLFEGYWPGEGWAGAPWRWRRDRWQKWMDARARTDDGLGDEQGRLTDEIAAWRSIAKSAEGNRAVAARPAAQNHSSIADELATLEAQTAQDSLANLSVDQLQDFRLTAERVAAGSRGAAGANARRRLDSVAANVTDEINRRFLELRARRAAVEADLFLLLPPSREEVMATRLGNVLKSSEVYGRERYGLDSVTVWPRLYPLLPSTVIDDFEDALSSLDLMTLLCVLTVGFGLPISVLIAAGPAIQLSLAIRVLLGIAVGAAFLVIAGLCYNGAVQAAVAYGEKLKAVIDLYRGLLLKELSIEQPTTRRAEKRLWAELCAFLYRGDEPTTPIVVPNRGLPAFAPIADADVEEALFAWSELPSDSVRRRDEVVGRVPIVDLTEGQPVPSRVLVDRATIEGRAAVTVRPQREAEAAPALRIGDRVDIVLVPSPDTGKTRDLDTFSDLLVLGIGMHSSNNLGSDTTSFREITVAVPINQRDEFIRKSNSADAVVTTRLQPGAGHSFAKR